MVHQRIARRPRVAIKQKLERGLGEPAHFLSKVTTSAEQSLLLRCAAGADAAEARALRADAARGADWPRLLDAPDLTPLLGVALEMAGADATPIALAPSARCFSRTGCFEEYGAVRRHEGRSPTGSRVGE
jgi:hypothetical protein